jgi:acyl carrier protein
MDNAPMSRDTGEEITHLDELASIALVSYRVAFGDESVGAEDDFYALGGDSLTALRIAAALGEAMRAQVPLIAVFTNTTPNALADYLRRR